MRATVIIATMNRADQLAQLTLATLCTQSCTDFDIIVWDASLGDDTATVCAKCELPVYYFKAPRKGLTKQRNDAVDKAFQIFPNNDILIFLDDDVRLSCDAIEGVVETYSSNNSIAGVGIPILGHKRKQGKLQRFIKALFLNIEFPKRHMTPYAYGYQVDSEENGVFVNWLSGCSMSYRKNCFETTRFDERLCRFGGYCLAEDSVFSCSLYRQGKRFQLSERGSLVHVRDGNNRLDYRKMISSLLYNKGILFQEINKEKPMAVRVIWWCAFIWNQSYNTLSLFVRAIKAREVKAFFLGIGDLLLKEDKTANDQN